MLRLRPLSTSLLHRTAIQSKTNKLQFFNLHPNKTASLRTITTTEATDEKSTKNMQFLQNLHTTKGKEAAKKHLKLGMQTGKANNSHCNWAIRKLCDTSTEVKGLIKQMKLHEIPVGVETLNGLVTQFQLEGNAKEAQRVVDVVFEWEGVTPDSKTTEALATAGKLARIGLNMKLENVRKLKNILKSDGKEASMEYLIQSMHNGEASTINCGWAMKELCNTSDEAYDLRRQMNENNVRISESILTQLINQLLYEGKKEEAQLVLDFDFERYGLQPSGRTLATMADADRLASIGRTNKMKSLLKADGKEESMKYLQEMMYNGKANTFNCGWAMKEVCNTSDEMRDIINQMNDNNVPINEVILTQLINNLLFENKKEEAQHVLDNDFERYGLQPDDFTRKAMASADKLASIGRSRL